MLEKHVFLDQSGLDGIKYFVEKRFVAYAMKKVKP